MTDRAPAPEVYFYHLERQPLESVLPSLLERTLQRQWRAVVKLTSPERLEALDAHLWTYRDDSFLAHGSQRDGALDRQPIYLTRGDELPNGAHVLFLVDGATSASAPTGIQRIVHLFDGADPDALTQARASWKAAKAGGHAVTYWQQDDTGRWVNRA